MTDAPLVTVLIPARNEEADIERCLRAVLAQDHPHDRMEIVLVDGGSTDGTATVARSILESGDIAWKIVDNPAGTTPSNLNAGLAVASGEYLCRVDARSIIPVEYVRLCAEVLETRPDVVVTGGAQVAEPRSDAVIDVGIARALNNRFAMGGSRYRSGASSGPTDTVYLGAFRTSLPRSIGGWNPYFSTNQDYELNRRLGREGIVWFDARLAVAYIPRSSIAGLWRQYHRFGRWKVRYWRRTGDRPQRRQQLLIAALPATAAVIGCVLRMSRERDRKAWSLGLAAIAGAAAIEHRGSTVPEGGLAPRAVSVWSMAVVAVAWGSGVWREGLAGSRP
ncbi:glycosyltransferase family 2 protein [Actinospongicola halichondriae]|uniref:glycosyltransferase family 2 protein n=1 Tax=Actinospongicola halichondriae TaxID=3236844 RepID=UPI003D5C0A46